MAFMCSFCLKHLLHRHLASVHVSEEKHVCKTCQKAFSRGDSLLRHQRQHEGRERCHPCNVCDKSFFRKDNLKSHMKIHVKTKPNQVVLERVKDLTAYISASMVARVAYGWLREISKGWEAGWPSSRDPTCLSFVSMEKLDIGQIDTFQNFVKDEWVFNATEDYLCNTVDIPILKTWLEELRKSWLQSPKRVWDALKEKDIEQTIRTRLEEIFIPPWISKVNYHAVE
ncbi:hypothetical protein HOLleu_41395 [Holothuria leucospilota]|uniref:C2H2-type domain-containing protein n=1 Tax=Holothuria leucospilota TaxID=206669 RepID=A0A9Q0YBS0_HOLLE|nr:hypothetical protein HOLleu_41395 [Holothuria leucospilota]